MSDFHFCQLTQNRGKSGNIGKTFDFIILPEHISEKIDDQEDAQRIRIKAKAHFIIYGNIRIRNISGKSYSVLNLEGEVSHRPVPENISKSFSREFAELLPRRVKIESEDDFFTFDFTSEWTNCVSKYIIGIAAAFSFDYGYSIKLFEDVWNNLKTLDNKFPIYAKLATRIPIRLAEIYEARAGSYYDLWLNKFDDSLIPRIGDELDKVDECCKNRYRYILLKAAFLFLNDRNIENAIGLLKQCRKIEDCIWHFSLGFLYCYSGDLKLAIREYRNAMHYPIYPPTIRQIESFILHFIDIEPEKYQL